MRLAVNDFEWIWAYNLLVVLCGFYDGVLVILDEFFDQILAILSACFC
jgi:hypothetical protein